MAYDPNFHHRHSIRLKGYNYSQNGAYFVTICVQGHKCLFGKIVGADPCVCPDEIGRTRGFAPTNGSQMQLNDAGQMIEHWWLKLNNKFASVETDEYVVMPNHFHGIVIMDNILDKPLGQGRHLGLPLQRIVQWLKTMTTNDYIRGVKEYSWKSFQGRLWQRNYYEHIICNDEEMNVIREYIINNPLRWHLDIENVNHTGNDDLDEWISGHKPKL